MKGLRYGPGMNRENPTDLDDGAVKDETHFGFKTVERDQKSGMVRSVFNGVAGQYDLMNDLMSMGVHRLWKTAMIDWLNPQPGWRLLDVAGGTGDIAQRFLERADERSRECSPSSAVTVCDINEAMVGVGRDRALDRGALERISWTCGDAEKLPVASSSVDAYTIAFGIRNVTNIEAALAEAKRVLKPGGRFMCLEFSHVIIPGLKSAYDTYSFKVLPALGELVAKNREAYQYLAESIRQFPEQETFAEMIADAGLGQVKVRNLSGGIAALHSAWRI
jgi:demethylmenaquinone methyltransferase / 2-methoxy-6-polyprenyl-1,4-benzoquinol methylase